jgi:RNA polymerase sigma-70 factor, ECF subfamily
LDRHVIVSRSFEVDGMTAPAVPERGLPVTRADAFRSLAERHLDASYRLARAVLHDPAEAEDATHDALLQAWRKYSTLRDSARFEQWFSRILVNTCRDRLRRTSAHPSRDLSTILVMPDTHDAFAQANERDAIGSALATLSPDHRVVVAMRFYAGMTADAIARQLGIPSGTVHSRLHYALRHLRQVIDASELKGTLR